MSDLINANIVETNNAAVIVPVDTSALSKVDGRNTVADTTVEGRPVFAFKVCVRFDATNKKGEKVRRRTVKIVWAETAEQALEYFDKVYGEFVSTLGDNLSGNFNVRTHGVKLAVVDQPVEADEPADEQVAA